MPPPRLIENTGAKTGSFGECWSDRLDTLEELDTADTKMSSRLVLCQN